MLFATMRCSFFSGRGFAEAPPLAMLTGVEFNGGLRYDETRSEPLAGPAMTVQTAARVDDIEERTQPGVLAAFTIFGISHPQPVEPTLLVAAIVDFLIDERRLDPDRHAVRLDRAVPAAGRPARPRRCRLRSSSGRFEEARAMGDGSGVFAPAGHPLAPRIASVGVYHRLPGIRRARWWPIHRKAISRLPRSASRRYEGDHDVPLGAAIGLERVAMAEGNAVPDFEETRLNLLRVIEDEARRTGKDLPPGYAKFASL